MKRVFIKILHFYQKFLTLFSYGSCRYYPTCSEYALWQIQGENLLFGLLKSAFRILRCNQLFAGGIDYPVVYRRHIKPIYKKIDVQFWLVPKGKNRYYFIKNFKG